jgi:predicted Zn-dependent peptidase
MIPHHLCAIIFLLFVTVSVASGQLDRTKKPESGPIPSLTLPTIQRASLENGLRVMLVEHHELPVVQMNMVLLSGSAKDPEQKAGLANVTAAMMDEGTAKRTALEVADDIDFIGASLSVSSSVDATFASLLTLKEHLKAALEIYADVLLSPAFPAVEWERVRKTHLAALLQQKDQPGTVASKVFSRITYGVDHPFGRPLDGSEETIQSITVGDIRDFYNAHYRPDNATLIVVGDVVMEELLPFVRDDFGGWKPGAGASAEVPAPPVINRTGIYLVDKPEAAQSEIRIGHVGVERNNPDYFSVVVMNMILGGQFSSRINLNLRESKGYTYGARSGFSMWKHPGPFTASAAVKTAVTDSSVMEFMKELKKIRDEDVTMQELEFARNSLIRREPQSFETPQQIASQLASLVLYDLPDNYFETYVENFENVTIADVRRVAQKVLNPSAMNIVIVGDVAAIKNDLEGLGYGPVKLLDTAGKTVN